MSASTVPNGGRAGVEDKTGDSAGKQLRVFRY